MKSFEERKNAIVNLIDSDFYVPMKEKELAVIMQVTLTDRPLFKQALEELLSENRLQMTKRGRYVKPEEKTLTGTFIGSGRNYGFVEVDGEKEDYYVPENMVHGAFHQDTVEIALLPGQRGKRQEAKVLKIISHGISRIVGTFDGSKNFGFVIPDDSKVSQDIFIPKEDTMHAVSGHKVVAEITDYGKEGKKPEGKIVEILGHINDPGVDILSIIKGFELPVEFPEKVLNQAARAAVPVSAADRAGRMDLREVQMITIDGEDAKDLDDAVSLTVENGIYHLGVHIADVSNYVQENSALDREALKRGTSVYLVDRVIPMLPHTLSNGICSLNEGEDRLALSCLMDIDEKGNVTDYKIAETVIRVDRRMTYTDVAAMIEEEDEGLKSKYRELFPMILQMAKLSKILRKKRRERGSVDFDFRESKIILDSEGKPLDIRPYDRNVATKLIEDFMLIANETVAGHFYWLEIPFVYRTHEAPDPEKIRNLELLIRGFGYYLKASKDEIHPKELQKLLGRIEGTDEENLICRLTLRSMKQARYTTECTGHFGLAVPYYCHFTSPIRRYPDLQIHRIIKEHIRGRMDGNRISHYRDILSGVCKRASDLERRADEAERETEKCKKAQFMKTKIGETFTGVISGVTGWGLYVELPNTVEGLVHISKMSGDYYIYDEAAYEIYGKTGGRTFRLGQKVDIVVYDVDLVSNTIDFLLAEDDR